jgi:hypothetical protein
MMKALSGERRNAVPSLKPASGSPLVAAFGGGTTKTVGGAGGPAGGGAAIGGGGGGAGGASAGGAGGGGEGAAASSGIGICAKAALENSERSATDAARVVIVMAPHVTPALLQNRGVKVKYRKLPRSFLYRAQ